MKSSTSIILTLIGCLAIAAIVVGAIILIQKPTMHDVASPDEDATNNLVVFEDGYVADTLMVGKWTSEANPKWYKVYYDDYAGDDFFWGKEWNEAEDVLEEDLRFHGNGWFKWRKKGDKLLEIAMQDQGVGEVPHEYIVQDNTDSVLTIAEKSHRMRSLHFHRIAD